MAKNEFIYSAMKAKAASYVVPSNTENLLKIRLSGSDYAVIPRRLAGGGLLG